MCLASSSPVQMLARIIGDAWHETHLERGMSGMCAETPTLVRKSSMALVKLCDAVTWGPT